MVKFGCVWWGDVLCGKARIKMGERKFQCPICKRWFNVEWSFNEHLLNCIGLDVKEEKKEIYDKPTNDLFSKLIKTNEQLNKEILKLKTQLKIEIEKKELERTKKYESQALVSRYKHEIKNIYEDKLKVTNKLQRLNKLKKCYELSMSSGKKTPAKQIISQQQRVIDLQQSEIDGLKKKLKEISGEEFVPSSSFLWEID